MPDIMKDNSFDSAMDKIVGQALAEKQQELLAQQRRLEFAKIRTIAWSVAGAVVLIFVASHQAELQNLLTNKLNKKPTISATTSSQLDQIEQGAEKRDAIIGEITK